MLAAYLIEAGLSGTLTLYASKALLLLYALVVTHVLKVAGLLLQLNELLGSDIALMLEGEYGIRKGLHQHKVVGGDKYLVASCEGGLQKVDQEKLGPKTEGCFRLVKSYVRILGIVDEFDDGQQDLPV